MTAATALVLGGLMTSCTKDTDLSGGTARNSQDVQKTYEEAFLNTFGRPVEGLDWGFGIANSATRAFTRAKGDYDAYLKGDLTVDVSFPKDANASNFDPDLTGIPSYEDYCKSLGNANWTPDEFSSGIVYIDKVQKVKIYGYNSGSKLYIKAGTYDFSDTEFNLAAGTEVYLLPGAELTLNNDAASTAKFTLYIASTAKLIANGEQGFRADVDAHVYNHGTIECSRFEVNVTSFLYNVGTLKVPAGDVYIANNNSKIVNDGNINSASVHVEGSGALQNNAEWTVTGNTVVNCTNGGWVNNGHWTTQNYHYTAGSNNVINNCFLEVKDDFYMNFGSGSYDFKINSGGSVLTKNFYGGGAVEVEEPKTAGPFKITMGAKSLFKVTNECYLDATASGIATYKYGFEGVGVGEKNAAVLQAKYVKNHGVPGHGYVAYSGNLYVSAEEHFAQGTTGAADGTSYIIFKDGCSEANIYAPGFNETGKPSVTIDKTPCNPGFDGKDPTPPGPGVDPDASEVMVVAEDLSTYVSTDGKELADFDFNDVVFEVSKGNNDMVHIKLLAAGGTLPLTVGDPTTDLQRPTMEMQKDSQGNDMEEVLKYEVHRRFKVSTGTMVNTNSTTSGATRDPVEFDIPYPDGVTSASTIYAIANAIPIRVYREDLSSDTNEKKWIEIQKAEAVSSSSASRITASKLCVDKTYTWCDERIHIDQNFEYIDAYGNNKGSRFRMWLRGELPNYWWRSNVTATSGDN